MPTAFADSGYWIAMLNPQDEWAGNAVRATQALGDDLHIVTTQEVLAETLNFFAGFGPELRRHAADAIREILTADNVSVLPQSPESFLSGLDVYEGSGEATHTDCVSMAVMEDEGITAVLSPDDRLTSAL